MCNRYRDQCSPRDWSTLTNVVYVVFHSKTSKFYVGETCRQASRRLREHWYSRHASSSASTLSQFFNDAERFKPDVIHDCRVFVVCHCTSDSQRKKTEMSTIAYLRQGFMKEHCLNRDVPTGKRLRHRPFLVREPQRPNVLTDASPVNPTIRHLMELDKSKTLESIHAMGLAKLRSIRSYAPAKSPLRKWITDAISAKLHDAQQRKRESRTVFTLPFVSKQMDNIHFKRLIRKTSGKWPFSDFHLKECIVARKFNTEIGSSIRNHVDASLFCDLQSGSVGSCACERFDASLKKDGHVLSVDHSAFLRAFGLPEERVAVCADLIGFHGSKFRFARSLAAGLAKLRETAMEFAQKCAKKDGKELDEEKLQSWISVLEEEVKAAALRCNVVEAVRVDVAKLLEDVHKDFVLAPCDKNPQHTAVWCRKHYSSVLATTISESFEPVPSRTSPQDVIIKHLGLAKKLGFRAYSTLPYVYAMPKIHKLETHRSPYRAIVGKSLRNKVDPPADQPAGTPWPAAKPDCNSLSDLRRHVAAALNSVIDVLVRKDVGKKIKRCWITRGDQEFIDSTARVPHPSRLSTADFTTMYTQLKHDELIDAVIRAIDEASLIVADYFKMGSRHRDLTLRIDKTGCWSDRGGLSMEELKQAVRECVNNAYVLVNGKLFRQTVGIGMGHEESPPLANLYLYARECAYVDRKIEELGEEEVERRFLGFRFHRRFIDDLFAPISADDLPTEDDYGLKLKITGDGSEAVFLGILVKIQEDRLTYRARDKQHGFDFKITRFPSWDSCVPVSCKRGTVIAMLSRTLSLTTLTTNFVDEGRFLLRMFAERGYPFTFVKEGVRRFLAKNILVPHRASLLKSLLEYEHYPPSAEAAATPPVPVAGEPLSLSISPARDPTTSASDLDAAPVDTHEAPTPDSQTPRSRGRRNLRLSLRPRPSLRLSLRVRPDAASSSASASIPALNSEPAPTSPRRASVATTEQASQTAPTLYPTPPAPEPAADHSDADQAPAAAASTSLVAVDGNEESQSQMLLSAVRSSMAQFAEGLAAAMRTSMCDAATAAVHQSQASLAPALQGVSTALQQLDPHAATARHHESLRIMLGELAERQHSALRAITSENTTRLLAMSASQEQSLQRIATAQAGHFRHTLSALTGSLRQISGAQFASLRALADTSAASQRRIAMENAAAMRQMIQLQAVPQHSLSVHLPELPQLLDRQQALMHSLAEQQHACLRQLCEGQRQVAIEHAASLRQIESDRAARDSHTASALQVVSDTIGSASSALSAAVNTSQTSTSSLESVTRDQMNLIRHLLSDVGSRNEGMLRSVITTVVERAFPLDDRRELGDALRRLNTTARIINSPMFRAASVEVLSSKKTSREPSSSRGQSSATSSVPTHEPDPSRGHRAESTTSTNSKPEERERDESPEPRDPAA